MRVNVCVCVCECVVYGWMCVFSCTSKVNSSSVIDTGRPETYTVSPCGLKDVAFTLKCVAPPSDVAA